MLLKRRIRMFIDLGLQGGLIRFPDFRLHSRLRLGSDIPRLFIPLDIALDRT